MWMAFNDGARIDSQSGDPVPPGANLQKAAYLRFGALERVISSFIEYSLIVFYIVWHVFPIN